MKRARSESVSMLVNGWPCTKGRIFVLCAISGPFVKALGVGCGHRASAIHTRLHHRFFALVQIVPFVAGKQQRPERR